MSWEQELNALCRLSKKVRGSGKNNRQMGKEAQIERPTQWGRTQLAAVYTSAGLVSDCGILFLSWLNALPWHHPVVPPSTDVLPWVLRRVPHLQGFPCRLQDGSWWLLEPCSEAWGPLPHCKTSAPAVTSYSSSGKINLQLCCRRYKRAFGRASHAFLLLQSDHQSAQNVLVCLMSSRCRMFSWL